MPKMNAVSLMRDMTNMSNKRRLAYVLERDHGRCGVHLGGCGERYISPGKGSAGGDRFSLDHIVSESWWKDKQSVGTRYYNQEWNFQPMHRACNNNDKKGQVYGFPVFSCHCHWLRIDQTEKGYILILFYRKGNHAFGNQICDERDLIVKSHQDLENSINLEPGTSLVEMRTVVWSLANHEPGVEGITGPGFGGHGLPILSPNEVLEFNQLELQRITGTTVETIGKFNPQPDEPRITAIYTT